jgi:hypothetical protein
MLLDFAAECVGNRLSRLEMLVNTPPLRSPSSTRAAARPRMTVDQSALDALAKVTQVRPPPEGMDRTVIVKFFPPA